MSTKELIHCEVERAKEEDLDSLYDLVREFVAARNGSQSEEDVFTRLMRYEFEGPEDFSTNIDLYLSGEKSIATCPNAD